MQKCDRKSKRSRKRSQIQSQKRRMRRHCWLRIFLESSGTCGKLLTYCLETSNLWEFELDRIGLNSTSDLGEMRNRQLAAWKEQKYMENELELLYKVKSHLASLSAVPTRANTAKSEPAAHHAAHRPQAAAVPPALGRAAEAGTAAVHQQTRTRRSSRPTPASNTTANTAAGESSRPTSPSSTESRSDESN